jgi:hypothetical protein
VSFDECLKRRGRRSNGNSTRHLDLGGPRGTNHSRLLPSQKSIYSLSIYGWLSFKHKLKFTLDVENGAPK